MFGGRMRHRCDARRALAVLLALAVVAAVPATSAGAAQRPRSSPFHVRVDPPGATSFVGASCPAASVCFAAGGGSAERAVVFKTVNGGRSWTRESTPPGMVSITGISCPSTTFCLAVGEGPYQPYFVSTHNGGASWSEWIDQDLFNESVTQVTCVTPSVCLAPLGVGGLVRSRDGGVTWTAVHTPQLAAVSDISCVGTTTCVIAGAAPSSGEVGVDRSTNAGESFGSIASFSAPSAPHPSIACGTTTSCLLTGAGTTGGVVETTTNAGRSWRASSLPSVVETAIGDSCAPTGSCEVIGATAASNLVVATTNETASTWTATSLAHAPGAAGAPGALGCDRAVCVVVGYDTAPSTLFVRPGDVGSFRRVTTAAGPGALTGVACPSDLRCVAVGTGLALRSDNGGLSWSTATGIAGSAQLDAVACPTASICLAVGDLDRMNQPTIAAAYRSTDGGATWVRVGLPPGHASLAAIACGSTTTCVAVSSDGAPTVLRTTNAGSSFSVVAVTGETAVSLSSVACPSATACLAVGLDTDGGVALVSTDGGATWSVGSGASALGDYLQSVSCSGPTRCLAAGALEPIGPGVESTAIYSSSDGGDTWATMPSAPVSFDVGDLSCLANTCEELATPQANYGPPSSTLETSTDAGGAWSVTGLPAPGILSAVTATPSGRWVIVGTSTLNGALVLTTS